MSQKSKKIAKGATESLKILWENGFFKGWRNYPQIVDQQAQEDYHFSMAENCMALKRAKYLTRRGKRGNYEYIQKYPFFENNEK